MQVMEERRAILAKLQMVNIPDRMMALQSVIAETIKVSRVAGCVTPFQRRRSAPPFRLMRDAGGEDVSKESVGPAGLLRAYLSALS